jgi:hypothetical protein
MALCIKTLMEIDMHEQKKQAIIDKLTSIIKTMPDVSAFKEVPSPSRYQVVGDRAIFLMGEGYTTFDRLCDMLQGEKS